MDQVIVLCAAIFLPPLIGAALIARFMGDGKTLSSRLRSIFTLHPEAGLIHQGLLWLCIAVPFLYFCVLGAIAWHGSDIRMDYEGFKRFIEISVLPLASLSISLPLAGLVSKFHSTQQTAIQIKVVSQKNNFDAFFSHRKELFAYFGQIGSVNYLGCLDASYKIHPAVHQSFFSGDPKNGIPQPRLSAFDAIKGTLSFIAQTLDCTIRGDDPDEAFNFYLNACGDLLRIAGSLGVREVSETLVEAGVSFKVEFTKGGENVVATVGKTTAEMLSAYRYVRNYFNNICSFAGVDRHALDSRYHYIIRGGQQLLDRDDLMIERIHSTIIKKYLDDEALAKIMR